MSNPRVTVAIPVYNVQDYVAETLDSLLAQTYTDFEAIIVNDGSTDDSAKVIEPYLKDERLRYVFQENKGLGAARNTALELARGEWFAQLDSDDIWLPEKLEKQIALTDSDPKANMIYCNATVFLPDGRERPWYYDESQMREGDITEWLYEDNYLVGSTIMVKTADLKAVGGYGTKPLGEDYVAWLKLAQHYLYARAVKERMIRYRIRVGSLVSDRIQNRVRQVEIMSAALEREKRPRYHRLLAKGIQAVRSNVAYEMAIRAVRFGHDEETERYLWESWRINRTNFKRLAIAIAFSAGSIPGLRLGRSYVVDRLRQIRSDWESVPQRAKQ